MMIYLKNDPDYKQFQQSGFFRRANPIALFNIILRNCPGYMKFIAVAGLFYAPINLLIPLADPTIEINTTRLLSGHWIAFYGVAMAVLYPLKKETVL